MKKHGYFLMGLALVVLISPSWTWSENKPKGNPPVITASFATERGFYGSIWKIYLEAEDPDGDMNRIAVEVDQLGYGRYPTDWTIIKPSFQKKLKGYLQWNTFSSRASFLREWTYITVKVSIVDKSGNWSNEVVFPFEFVSGGQKRIAPPAPFAQEGLPRLGYIFIDLFEPTQMGADANWEK